MTESRARTIALTSLAIIAFAGNSLLCRAALRDTSVDPATFTLVRLASGAAVLWALSRVRGDVPSRHGDWASAVALVAYAATFSAAYATLPAATGALILFGAVQATMVGGSLWRGEHLGWRGASGLVVALGGLAFLLAPGLSAPPLAGAALMMSAGAAWGAYSLRGRATGHPTSVTAGNFLRAALLAVIFELGSFKSWSFDGTGAAYAVASGAITSGVGYAIWYAALRGLRGATAAAVQLTVPVVATLGGYLLLGEPIGSRLLGAATAIVGGIAIVVGRRKPRTS